MNKIIQEIEDTFKAIVDNTEIEGGYEITEEIADIWIDRQTARERILVEFKISLLKLKQSMLDSLPEEKYVPDPIEVNGERDLNYSQERNKKIGFNQAIREIKQKWI